MTDKPELQEVEAVYMGRRILSDKTLGDAWILLSTLEAIITKDEYQFQEQLLNSMLSVFKADKTKPVIGGVYKVNVRIDTDRITSLGGKREYKRRLDSPHVMAWDAVDESEYARYRNKKLEVKIKTESAFKNMKALKEAYKKTPYRDRLAFELMVINELRGAW